MKLLAAALIKAKSNFEPIYKNKINPHFKNKYAGLDGILDAIELALSDAGLLLIQPTALRDNQTILQTIIIHAESGEQMISELKLPEIADPQKLGAAMTYYRRFSLCSLLAIAPDDDDDGNIAREAKLVSDRQTTISQLIESLGLERTAVGEMIKTQFNKRVGEMNDGEYKEMLKSITLMKKNE